MPDLDNDGWPDVVYVTGHVYPEIERHLPQYPHRGPRMVFQGQDGRRFEDVSARSGPGATTPHSSRGAAFGDYDEDGDLDMLVMNMNEPPSLLRNETRNANRWLKVKLVGTQSNRAGIGATVIVTADGRRQAQAVLSQSSYYSHDDLRLHFGLGAARAAEKVEVRWPSGGVDVVRDVDAQPRAHRPRRQRPVNGYCEGEGDLAADVGAAGPLEATASRAPPGAGPTTVTPGAAPERPRRPHAQLVAAPGAPFEDEPEQASRSAVARTMRRPSLAAPGPGVDGGGVHLGPAFDGEHDLASWRAGCATTTCARWMSPTPRDLERRRPGRRRVADDHARVEGKRGGDDEPRRRRRAGTPHRRDLHAARPRARGRGRSAPRPRGRWSRTRGPSPRGAGGRRSASARRPWPRCPGARAPAASPPSPPTRPGGATSGRRAR